MGLRLFIPVAAIAAAMCAAPAGAQPGGAVPFAFVVPVSLNNLHANLTMVRTRCWVFPSTNWRADGGALGEGLSGPLQTRLEGGVRVFAGDMTVSVPLRDSRVEASAARSYRCAVELYDVAARHWADIPQIDKRYPLDQETRSIAETGGLLGQ